MHGVRLGGPELVGMEINGKSCGPLRVPDSSEVPENRRPQLGEASTTSYSLSLAASLLRRTE